MIIGLVGAARSGKTTVAEHWAATQNFHIVSFAEELKTLVRDALVSNPPPGFKLPKDEWERLLWVDRTEFTRWLLQFVGTDIVRQVDERYWVDKAMQFINQMAWENVVIPDVRFRNEAAALQNLGGVMVRVVRVDPERDSWVEYGSNHPSEREQQLITSDYGISSGSGVERLKIEADKILRRIQADEAERNEAKCLLPRS